MKVWRGGGGGKSGDNRMRRESAEAVVRLAKKSEGGDVGVKQWRRNRLKKKKTSWRR